MAALAEERGKSRETAVKVALDPRGGVRGAVYTPLPSTIPSVALPPRIGLVPGPDRYQSSLVVKDPVTVEVKVFEFAVPEGIVQEVGEMVTTGGGVIVTVEVADTSVSSKEVAEMVTVEGVGTVFGAW